MTTRRTPLTILVVLAGSCGLLACGDNINVEPVATNATITTPEDTVVTFTLEGVDPNGDEAIFRNVTEPVSGRLVLDDLPEVSYIPQLNFTGTDEFSFTVSDGLLSARGTITVIVEPINDAPTVSPIIDITTQNAALDVPFIIADVDNDLADLVITAVSDDLAVVPAENLVFGGGDDESRFINVTPAASGVASITITVSDGELENSEVFNYTVTNAGPNVVADTYDGVGNTRLVVDAGAGVLANDTDDEGDTLTVTPVTGAATTEGGTVDIAADGSFVYTPPVGVTAVGDTFLYEASDGFAAITQNATVNLADLVWYVDNTAAAGGDGRDTARFDTLAAATTAAGTGDAIFVFAGDATTTGQDAGVVLADDQRLIGEAAGLTINAVVLVAPGARPQITSTITDVINLADNNLVTGVALTVPAGERGIAEPNLTGVTLDDVTITNLLGNDTIDIGNNNAAAAVNITIQNCDITTDLDTQDAIDIVIAGTSGGHVVLDISDNTFTSTEGSQILVELDDTTGSSGTPNSVSITGNTGTFAMNLGPDGDSTSDIVIDNNTVAGGALTDRVVNVRVGMAAAGSANLTVTNNAVSDAAAECVRVLGSGNGNAGAIASLIDNNTFTDCGDPIRLNADDAATFSSTVSNNTSSSVGAGPIVVDFGANSAAVHNVFMSSNESIGGYELERELTGQVNLGGSLGQGSSFDDDNGNIANDGNTTLGLAPVVIITGTDLQIAIIDPTTIPTP